MRLTRLFLLPLLAPIFLSAQDSAATGLVAAGTVRPEVASSLDLGAVESSMRLDGLVLELRPKPAEKRALAATVRALHDPASPTFHQWLTPAQFSALLAIPQDSVTTA